VKKKREMCDAYTNTCVETRYKALQWILAINTIT